MLQQVAKSAVLLMLMTTADAYGLQKNQAAANNNNNNHRSDVLSRRELGAQTLRNLVAGTAVASTLTSSPDAALATDDDVDVYFGVGCFWHIQHEFVDAERKILGRGDKELTARTGYAGGKKTDAEGRVCYHNFQNVADYGKLGHGEVVGLSLPSNMVEEFADVYFGLYNPKTKDRVDPQDKGGEYRSLIGLPKGTDNPLYEGIAKAAQRAGFKLEKGKGSDSDTLGKQLVYVYDSNKFPFYQAEVYHQFHNDFRSPAYGKEYNDLVNLALDDGRIRGTGCPDRV